MNVEYKYKLLFALPFSLPGRYLIGSQTCIVESDTPDILSIVYVL